MVKRTGMWCDFDLAANQYRVYIDMIRGVSIAHVGARNYQAEYRDYE